MALCEITKWHKRQTGMTTGRRSRPVYAWSWECSCGDTTQTNEAKPEATKMWRSHRDTVERHVAEYVKTIVPAVRAMYRFAQARDNMRGDHSRKNVEKMWERMKVARDEWEDATCSISATMDRLDEVTWPAEGHPLRFINLPEDQFTEELEKFLDSVSEYL